MTGKVSAGNDIALAVVALKDSPDFGLDLETTGFDPRVDRIKSVAVSVGMKPSQTWNFPFTGTGAVSQVQTFRELAPVLSDPAKLFVNSNVKFELEFLRMNGVEVECRIADTMIAHWMLDENANHHGLKEIVAEELGFEMMTYKDAIKFEVSLFEDERRKWEEYCRNDPRYALKVWRDKLQPRLEKQDLERGFFSLEMEIVRVIAEMELAGVMVDVPYLVGYKTKLEALVLTATEEARKLVGHPFDVGSPTQVSRVLFEEMGLAPKFERGKNGHYSTDDFVLESLGEVPIVKSILKFRESSKILTTYVNSYLNKATERGRIHTSFKQTGTVTGRFSSAEPNLQNVPSGKNSIKRCFVAPQGKSFVVGDFNQMEFRVAAHFAMHFLRQSAIADAYLKGEDLHAKTMRELGFEKETPNDPVSARRKAKVVNFGFIYGRGAKSFAEDNKLPLETAKAWRTNFHYAYRELRLLRDECSRMLYEDGFITTLTNRRRRFPDWKGVTEATLKARADTEKWSTEEFEAKRFSLYWSGWVAWNSLVQGSTADYVKVTMRNFWRERKQRMTTQPGWANVNLLIQVHDELVIETPDELIPEVEETLRRLGESAMKLKVPVKMDVGHGKTWEAAK